MYPHQAPAWKCPRCGRGIPTINEDDFRSEVTEQSKRERNHPDWEPEWLRYTFSAFLNCTHCKEKTVTIGEGKVDTFNGQDTGEWGCEEVFMPKYFIPPLQLFEIPSDCPKSVKEHINESFSLAWADFSAAGNKLRVAVEKLIDAIHPGSSGTLHNRIGKLPSQHEGIKDWLLAVKWLGNEGSHQAQLQEYDVAFAYDVFLLVLNKLYGKGKDLGELVKLVNVAKGSIAK